MTLRISHPEAEGVYQGAKWLKIQVLCDGDELEDLFARLAPFWIFPLTGVVDGLPIQPEVFLAEYRNWMLDLQRGMVPSDGVLRRLLACAFTEDLSALWLQRVTRGYLVKIAKPVVQVQAHFFSYSPLDGVFRSMSLGQDSIFWGLQWSFPQVYQDPKTMEIHEGGRGELFRKIQLWMRDRTRPTPWIIEGKQVNTSMRLGKGCFSWIGAHPQLAQHRLRVCAH